MEFWKFFNFFKEHFEGSTLHGTLGKIIFSKKLPQNVFKTYLDILGTILGILESLKLFWFFENISKTRPSMEHWGKNFSKLLTQIMFKTRLDTFGNDLGIFAILKIYWFFENISKSRPSMEHWAKKNFRKNYPIPCSKHVWTLFGTILSFFGILKNFVFLKTFRGLDPTWNTGQKKNFLEKLPQNMFKTRLAILGTISGIYGILKILWFKNISKTRPSMEHWAKNFLSKILTENMFKTRLDNFGNDFGHFCNFENFLIFWKHFEDSTLHGTLGKKNFRKNYPKTCSKHVWTLLGTI